jgi:hypothetical protein
LNVVGQLDGVGLVLERDQAGHRAEDFFLGDAHAVVHVGKHGRPDEVAVLHRLGQLGGVAGLVQAAAQQRGAFLGAEFDVAAHLGQVGLRNHRADDGFFVQRVAHGDAPGALHELLDEVGVDALLHQDAAAGGAALAVVGEDHEDAASSARSRSASSKITNGLLPPSSMLNFFRPAALHDAVAGGRRAGERDGAHVGVGAQRLASFLAIAVHQFSTPAGCRPPAPARPGARRSAATARSSSAPRCCRRPGRARPSRWPS